MKDKLKELEELIGTDSYNRVLRIMSFIGARVICIFLVIVLGLK